MPRIYNLTKFEERRRQLRRDSTKAEILLWNALRSKQFMSLKFRRQHSVGNYILDFYCDKIRLAIEVDGETHSTAHQQEYDRARTEWLNSMFIRVIRFTNDEVIEDLEGVLKRLRFAITSPDPS